MAKPFALTELEARVRALTRRSAGAGTTQLRYKRLSFDLNGRTARIDGNPLELSARETNLPEIFLSRRGRMLSQNQFVDLLFEWGDVVTPNPIAVYIHPLSQKIEPSGPTIDLLPAMGFHLQLHNHTHTMAQYPCQ